MQAKNIFNKLILPAILIGGAAVCILSLWQSYKANGGFGFPLDDPWIHLQFAKNLHDYGSYSYFRNEMLTSGSTSPLYTLILAACFFISRDEMAISYFLGVAFLLMAAFYMYRLALKDFGGKLTFAGSAAILLLMEPRLIWASLSGMETTLFIFLLLAVAYYYKSRKTVQLGIFSGLLLWTRPEAVLFVAVLGIDAAYGAFYARGPKLKRPKISPAVESVGWLLKPVLIFLLFAAGYLALNLLLSGSALPNTYSAKIKYYSGGGGTPNFPEQVFHFLTDGHLLLVSFFACAGILSILGGFIKRMGQEYLVYFLWSLGLFLAYWKELPFLYQQGRYMMPILPFYLLLGLGGVRIIIEGCKRFVTGFSKGRTAPVTLAVFILIITVQFAFAWPSWWKEYAEYCDYISQRQVRTARWLRDNLPPSAVIATHDIGAIGYYSGRKIADMVGLVSPEMIDRIGSFEKLTQFLKVKKATHIAVLRNWFEVANQNPIFQTDENRPEIMEVFEIGPAQIHFTPQNVTSMTEAAKYYLSLGVVQQARELLETSARMDPMSSKVHYLLGETYMKAGNLEKAEAELLRSALLHPNYVEAYSAISRLYATKGRPGEAIEYLEKILSVNASYPEAYRQLAGIYATFHLDSLKAAECLRRYHELSEDTAR